LLVELGDYLFFRFPIQIRPPFLILLLTNIFSPGKEGCKAEPNIGKQGTIQGEIRKTIRFTVRYGNTPRFGLGRPTSVD